jgi:hypothetical protein
LQGCFGRKLTLVQIPKQFHRPRPMPLIVVVRVRVDFQILRSFP